MQRMEDALGDAQRRCLGVRRLDEHRELVAAEAGDHLAFGGADEALAEHRKELVTHAVAEGVRRLSAAGFTERNCES